jgi:KDO2-lipid IV(A) lauroyltransferase
MKHPIRRRFMFLGFQGLRAVARRLPLGVLRGMGRALGRLAYGVLASQRRLARDHLASAFGSVLPDARRRQIVQGVFRNLGQTAMEWLRLPTLSTSELHRLVTGEGLQHLRDALAQGQGVVLVTGHLGNWEVIPPYLTSLGFEGAVLARRLRYPEYEPFFVALRGAKGVATLTRGSLAQVARYLRRNQIVGVLPDQDVDSLQGIFVGFFGRPAYTPVGPAALSLLTGAPIIPCFAIREGKRFRLVVEPPLRAPSGMDRAQALTHLTQAWSDVVESYVRRYPDQWVWMHRRWKTLPRPAISAQPVVETAQRSPLAPSGLALLLTASCFLLSFLAGCGKPSPKPEAVAPPAPDTDQAMSEFTLTGYNQDGATRWTLSGRGATLDGNVMTILRPDAVGYEPGRSASLTASVANVQQDTRHVRLEHDVTIHTSDGMWFTSPVLHWIPDQDRIATDQPVRIETDHMLLRGRGASGLTQLKRARVLEDIEVVLNPSDGRAASDGPPAPQVVITCDGPLTFDAEHHVATFERNVHVKDPSGDLWSDTLIAHLDEATRAIRYADAVGRVRMQQGQDTALSERAVYELVSGKITLVGRPSLLIYPDSDSPQPARLSFGGLVGAPPSPSAAAPPAPSE